MNFIRYLINGFVIYGPFAILFKYIGLVDHIHDIAISKSKRGVNKYKL